MWAEDCSASWDFMLHRSRGFNCSEVPLKNNLAPSAWSRSRSRSTGSRSEGRNLQRDILGQFLDVQSLLKEKCEILYCVDSVYPFSFVFRKRWGLKWKTCVVRKSLPSPDSIQLPKPGYSCTINVFSYWFSSPTLSLLWLFLSLPFFYSISHYFSPSSHRGFSNRLPWLTWAAKWASLYCRTLTTDGEEREPAHTKLHFLSRSKFVTDFFFLFFLFIFTPGALN